MVLILFLCSCLLTVYSGGKSVLGFLQETSAKFLVHCVSILGLGYVRIEKLD